MIESWLTTAQRFCSSARKVASSAPVMNREIRRHASTMSSIVADSSCIDGLSGFQDLTPSNPVFALFNRATVHEVDGSPEDRCKFLFGCNDVPKSPMRFSRESYENVDIARVLEIVAKHRTEERQFTNLPSGAICSDGLGRQIEMDRGHGTHAQGCEKRTRRDSNPQPLVPKTNALSIELRVRAKRLG